MEIKTGVLLSACLMVKNESANLDRCLSSLQGFADEIIVVDTGSTDNTVEIAEKFGAKIYHHPWEDDFSKHRNQSISYANGKWILIIDADEEIVLNENFSLATFREFLLKIAKEKYLASAITVKDIQKKMVCLQFTSSRFFMNGKIQYEGRVHNRAKIDGESKALFCDQLSINHYGYDLTPEQKQAKFVRTSSLLLKQIENDELYNGLTYFYLCQIYANNYLHYDAVQWGERYKNYIDRNNVDKDLVCKSIYFSMIKSYMQIKNTKKAHDWLNLGIQEVPGDLDIAFVALEFGIYSNNEDLILNAARDYVSIYDKFDSDPSLKGNRFVFSLRPEALCFALFHLSVLQAKQSITTLGKLMDNLEKVPKEFKNGMVEDIEINFNKIGIGLKFDK